MLSPFNDALCTAAIIDGEDDGSVEAAEMRSTLSLSKGPRTSVRPSKRRPGPARRGGRRPGPRGPRLPSAPIGAGQDLRVEAAVGQGFATASKTASSGGQRPGPRGARMALAWALGFDRGSARTSRRSHGARMGPRLRPVGQDLEALAWRFAGPSASTGHAREGQVTARGPSATTGTREAGGSSPFPGSRPASAGGKYCL